MEQITVMQRSSVQKRSSFSFARFSTSFLMVAGLSVSSYLLYRFYLVSSNTPNKFDVCSAVFGKGCDAALKSDVSKQLGLPLAAWGLLYYAVLIALVFFKKWNRQEFRATAINLMLFTSFTGCLVSLTLLCMMILDPNLLCPFCLVLHGLNLFLFISLNFENRDSNNPFEIFKTDVLDVFASNSATGRIKRLLFLGLLLFIAIVYSALFLFAQKALKAGSEFNAEKFLANYDATQVRQIPVENDDPVLGDLHSAVRFIVFSDFQCKYCRYFHFVIKELNKKYPGKLSFVFKYFPLGTACNTSIKEDIHPRACEAAWAAESARQQGKFWQFHDALFPIDLDRGDKTVCMVADSIGLDHQRFESYRTSVAVRKKIFRSAMLGKRLGVTGTPTVFVNGKQVDDINFEHLYLLINHILRRPITTK